MKRKIYYVIMLQFILAAFIFSQHWTAKDQTKPQTFKKIQKDFYKKWERYLKENPKPRKGVYKQFKRWEWFVSTRLDSNGYFNPTLNWKGWLEKKARFANKNNRQDATKKWTELGPTTMPDNTYCQSGGYRGLGRINCISFDPVNPDIIWVGAPSGGLWKSINGGTTWTSNTDNLPNLGVSSILIHPTDNRIMYIATGDGDGGDTFSIGILKSTDGGNSWFHIGNELGVSEGIRITKMKFIPNDPDTILVMASNGIYKLTNGGSNWSKKMSGRFMDLDLIPGSPNIWIATSYYSSGIFRSTNNGDSWTQVTNGLPTDINAMRRIAVATSQSSPSTVYAVIANSEQGMLGVYKSLDAGINWVQVVGSPNLLGWAFDGSDNSGQSYYDLTIDVDPANEDIVFIGGVSLWRSMDGGQTWQLNAYWLENDSTGYIHADHHAFERHPKKSNIIYSGNDGGIARSLDGGNSWEDISHGLGIHQIYRLSQAKTDEGLILIGNQDNGSDLYRYGSWHTVNWGDGMDNAIDPSNPNIMYSSSQRGYFYKSENGGVSWRYISTDDIGGNGAWVTPIVIDQTNPATIYTATNRIFRSDNRGNSWSSLGTALVDENSQFRYLAVSEANPDYLYAANRSQLYFSDDRGSQWTGITTSSLPTNVMTDIAVDPQSSTTLWITAGGYTAGQKIYRSGDRGNSWENLSGQLPNIPVNCVTVDPETAIVYIGTDLGVFYSTYANSNWIAYENGLPNVIINELEIHRGAKKIRAATYGRGVWEAPLVDEPLSFQPMGISVERKRNNSFLQTEYVDQLQWRSNPKNSNVGNLKYKLYRLKDGNAVEITELDGSSTEYLVRKVENIDTSYYVSAIYNGIESAKALTFTKKL